MTNKPEILSPAGDMDCLQSALSFGADAVFLAGRMFGMRSSPRNFDADELRRACPETNAFLIGDCLYVGSNVAAATSGALSAAAYL